MTKQWHPDDDDDEWLRNDSDESGYSGHEGFEGDYEEDDETETVECSKCGCDIYEGAEQCPLCGEWQSPQQRTVWTGRPKWFLLLGVLGIVGVILGQLWTAILGLFSKL